MNRTKLFFLLVLGVTALCVFACRRSEDPSKPAKRASNSVNYSAAQPGDVVMLESAEAFEDFIENAEIAVVKFGAEWCRPCQQLDPELDKIAGHFAASSASFARVDVDALPELAQSLAVGPIPDTRIFYDGRQYLQTLGNRPQVIANAVESLRQEVAEPAVVDDPVEALAEATSSEDEIVFDENFPIDPDAVLGFPTSDGFTLDVEPGEISVVETQDDLADLLQANDFVVVKFGAVWCPPCRALEAKLPLLAGYFEEDGVAFAMIDTDDSPDLAIDYGVGPIPDVRIFYQGKFVGQVVGNYPQEIMDAIQEVVDDPSAAIAIVPHEPFDDDDADVEEDLDEEGDVDEDDAFDADDLDFEDDASDADDLDFGDDDASDADELDFGDDDVGFDAYELEEIAE